MAARARSLRVTDAYRHRQALLREHGQRTARLGWQQVELEDLDASHERFVAQTAPALVVLQRTGARLSAGYLAAFLTSELDRAVIPHAPAEADYAGRARDGRPLHEALVPSLYTVKRAIGEGKAPAAALSEGLNRAVRVAGEEAVFAARGTLADAIHADERIIGWRRVTGGGCGACIAAATGAIQADDDVLEVHDHCQCTKEPVIADAPDRATRPSGPELFEAMSAERQDALLGTEKAELLRTGAIDFNDLIQRDPMAAIPDQITERPLEALKQQ